MFVCNCTFGFYVFKQPENDHVMSENVATHLHTVTKSDMLVVINTYFAIYAT